MELEQKYLSLLQEAERHQLTDVDNIRLCFQTLSLAAAIDRDCATLLAPWGLSEGRFVLLFCLMPRQTAWPPTCWRKKRASHAPPLPACLTAWSATSLLSAMPTP